jgi:hypothetical protein
MRHTDEKVWFGGCHGWVSKSERLERIRIDQSFSISDENLEELLKGLKV